VEAVVRPCGLQTFKASKVEFLNYRLKELLLVMPCSLEPTITNKSSFSWLPGPTIHLSSHSSTYPLFSHARALLQIQDAGGEQY
jgi:hypothetical protein